MTVLIKIDCTDWTKKNTCKTLKHCLKKLLLKAATATWANAWRDLWWRRCWGWWWRGRGCSTGCPWWSWSGSFGILRFQTYISNFIVLLTKLNLNHVETTVDWAVATHEEESKVTDSCGNYVPPARLLLVNGWQSWEQMITCCLSVSFRYLCFLLFAYPDIWRLKYKRIWCKSLWCGEKSDWGALF